MPTLKPDTIIPTDLEDEQIRAGIAQDPDTFELTEADFKRLRPVGRPPAAMTKQKITMRLSLEVMEYFRSLGAGWQTHIDQVLKDYVASQHR